MLFSRWQAKRRIVVREPASTCVLWGVTPFHSSIYGSSVVFDEKRVFNAGPLPGPVNFRGVRLGVMVCEDMWTDEVAECLQESGAEMLVVLNGSPYQQDKWDTRLNLAVARATDHKAVRRFNRGLLGLFNQTAPPMSAVRRLGLALMQSCPWSKERFARRGMGLGAGMPRWTRTP